MLDLINPAIALLTVAFGLFGFLAPRYTADVLDLKPTDSNMGLSELRASAGGLFVALGLGCLVLGTPMAYAMMGGIIMGTVITLLFVPALYLVVFRLKEPKDTNESALIEQGPMPAPQPAA